jgi:acyl carrier protein
MNIENELIKIIRNITNDDEVHLNLKTSFDEIQNWDSLSNVRFNLEINKIFNIDIAFSDFITFDNIQDVFNLIKKKYRPSK